MVSADHAERLFARTEERYGPEVAATVRTRFSEDDSELFRVVVDVFEEDLEDMGLLPLLVESTKHNLDRQEVAEEPLRELGLGFQPDDSLAALDRVIDRLVAIARGQHPPPLTTEQRDALGRWAYREITGREWAGDHTQ